MRNKALISAVLVVKDEEENIEECLSSVKAFADEIVVVDDGSNDKTVEIAKKFTDKIYHHESLGYVEPARNFAISKATGDWILILDADEEISSGLGKKLEEVVKNNTAEVVWIPRKNIIFNKWIKNNKGWWPDYNPRFFKKGAVVWQDKIHSKPEIKGKEMQLLAEEDLAIIHKNYKTVSDFVSRMNRYTDIESAEETVDWRNFVKDQNNELLSRLFAREGYKDGIHGLFLSYLESFYFVVVAAKIWEKKGFDDEDMSVKKFQKTIQSNHKDMQYWLLTIFIEQTKNPIKKVIYRIQRKLIV